VLSNQFYGPGRIRTADPLVRRKIFAENTRLRLPQQLLLAACSEFSFWCALMMRLIIIATW
jgi:hypothetical protein